MRRRERKQGVTQGDILIELAKAERIARQDRADARVIELMLDGEEQRAAERQAAREHLSGRRPE